MIRRATIAVVAVAAAAITLAAPPAQGKPAAPKLASTVVATARFGAAVLATAKDPESAPRGVNVACTPSKAHPYPVVLVNGTFEVMHTSFDYLGPRLAAAGYCVYGYNYGGNHPNDYVQAIGPVLKSVDALKAQVARVTKLTKTTKVDLVGFSQGGLITALFTKFGGAKNVHSVTALAPTTHGTTLLGIGTLGAAIPGALDALRKGGCPACSDQVVGSAVVRKLNTGPIAVKGIPYTVIDTKYEDVVTPSGISFIREPGVVNEFVQSFDPTNLDEHVVLPFNTTTGDRVLAALVRAKALRG